MKTEDILNEREKTHGDFNDVSYVSQGLKDFVSDYCPEDLNNRQQEALDFILGKVARIVCGDASYADHWDDIAGYAMLGKGGVKGKIMKGSGGISISEHVGSELLFDDAGEVKEKYTSYIVCGFCDNDVSTKESYHIRKGAQEIIECGFCNKDVGAGDFYYIRKVETDVSQEYNKEGGDLDYNTGYRAGFNNGSKYSERRYKEAFRKGVAISSAQNKQIIERMSQEKDKVLPDEDEE